MKFRFKNVVAAALVLVMLFCIMSVSAFAETAVPQYETYTVLGDSNPSGFGLDAYYNNAGGEKIKEGDLIAGSYPAIVAEAIGAEKVNVCSHSGWRTNELLRALGSDSFQDDGYGNLYWRALYYEELEVSDALAAKVLPAVLEADFITLQLGSNDIFTHSLNNVDRDFPDLLDSLEIEVPENIDSEAFFNLILEAADKAGILVDVVEDFLARMDANTATFKANMAAILDELQELNPDAKIYVVGVLNSINQTYVTENGTFLSLITTTDIRMAQVNQYLKDLCSEYENCVYVDAPNTDMFGIGVLDVEDIMQEDTTYYSALKIVHPTEKGHAYIAEKIIQAIKDSAVAAPVATVTKSTLFKKNIVKWTSVEDASMYRIYRSTSADGEYSYIGSTMCTSFIDLSGSSRGIYYYKVCAVMDYDCGIVTAMSEAVTA